MQVRDLIDQLQRFEPTANVRVELNDSVGHMSGMLRRFSERGKVESVEVEQAEPVIIAFE
jgi:hypothetical protein